MGANAESLRRKDVLLPVICEEKSVRRFTAHRNGRLIDFGIGLHCAYFVREDPVVKVIEDPVVPADVPDVGLIRVGNQYEIVPASQMAQQTLGNKQVGQKD